MFNNGEEDIKGKYFKQGANIEFDKTHGFIERIKQGKYRKIIKDLMAWWPKLGISN